MPWLFLAASIVGALFTLNAYRPSSRWQLIGVSFFAAWFTGELALWHVVWQAVATAGFVALGAFDAWPGWVGLAITFVSWAGLLWIGVTARRSAVVLGDALQAEAELEPVAPRRVKLRRIAFPLYLHDHRVERIKDLRYGPYGRCNLLDVYRPRDAGGRPAPGAPVLLQIHGGGWVIGDKGQQGLPLMLELAADGWVCVAANYRLSPRATWPEHLVDAKRALAWVREHIAEYGGDPDLVCITGGSAGGHLAAMVALTANDPAYQEGFEPADTSVAACIPFYGVYDFPGIFDAHGKGERIARTMSRWVMKTSIKDDRAAFEAASPMHHLRADAPPFFVIHGSRDNLVPASQAREFVAGLRAVSHAPVVYAEIPGASHAFDVFHSIRTTYAVDAVGRFLARVVHDRAAAPVAPSAPADLGPTSAVAGG